MKFIMTIVMCIILLSCSAFAKDCKDCPPDRPCEYTVPAGDGCNTCSGTTWCIDDRWYTEGTSLCTALACIKTYEITNPFTNKKGK